MGIASQEVIRQLQELIDQGLCFTNFLLLLSLFSFKDHIFFLKMLFFCINIFFVFWIMAVEEPLKKTYQVCISPLFLYIYFFLNFIFLCILFSNFLVAIEQKKKARYFFFWWILWAIELILNYLNGWLADWMVWSGNWVFLVPTSSFFCGELNVMWFRTRV